MKNKPLTSTVLHASLLLLLLLVSFTLSSPTPNNSRSRSKKHVSDQRIAELQALLALANSLQSQSDYYGHGHVDPFAAGRRRRSADFVSNRRSQIGGRLSRSPDNVETLRNRLKTIQWLCHAWRKMRHVCVTNINLCRHCEFLPAWVYKMAVLHWTNLLGILLENGRAC